MARNTKQKYSYLDVNPNRRFYVRDRILHGMQNFVRALPFHQNYQNAKNGKRWYQRHDFQLRPLLGTARWLWAASSTNAVLGSTLQQTKFCVQCKERILISTVCSSKFGSASGSPSRTCMRFSLIVIALSSIQYYVSFFAFGWLSALFSDNWLKWPGSTANHDL